MKSKDITRKVTLTGICDIMFDRYAGDNQTELRPDQKLYLMADGTICLPSANILSLLSAENTPSAPKRFLDSRKYKSVANAIRSFVTIPEMEIPFLREGKPIVFGGFDSTEHDPLSGCYVKRSVARLKNGIPNPKVRPVLPTPWELQFTMMLYANEEVQEETVQNLLVRSGVSIGLGTFRGVYGKFQVTNWQAA
jgi:hypothetical protein